MVIAAIISNISRILYGDTIIKNWKESGLLFPSLVAGVIQTIKNKMVIKKLGELSNKNFNKIKINLKRALVI